MLNLSMSLRPLAALLDALPVAFVAHDPDGNVVLWNPAAEALLGWSREEVLGRPSPIPNAILRGTSGTLADATASLSALSGAIAPAGGFAPPLTGPDALSGAIDPPITGLDASGLATAAQVPRVWLKDRAGTELEVAAAVMPIAGHAATAVALWSLPASPALDRPSLEALFDQLPLGALVVDPKGAIVGANAAIARLLGSSRDQILGHSVGEFLDAGAEGLPDGPFGALESRGTSVRLRRHGGAPLSVELTTVSLSADRAVAFFRDEHLETQGRLYARLFESSGEAMVICDAKNNIQAVNEAFTRITGYAAAEVIGQNPRVLSSGRHDAAFYARIWVALSTTGTWRGELWNRRKSGDVYCEWATLSAIKDSGGRVSNYVAVFADITAVKETERQVMYLAQRDHLTGLPNRTLLRDRLDQALNAAARTDQQVALMLVDLDGFKSVNSSLGPTEGDLLLKEVARRLELSVRVGDTVARMGGDEFAIVLTSLASSSESLTVESRVRAVIGEPLHLAGQDLRLTASIGIAVYPQDGAASDLLLSHADAAMYAAKDAGRNTSRFFTASMNERAVDRMSLTQGLGRALEKNELRLHFQPQRPIATERLLGVEALLRWQHPDIGLVPPDRFIYLAEETGLIRPIGVWVLRESALRAKAWGIPVSVNLSVVQLEDPDLYRHVQEVLAETGVAPELLELEVTESVVMKDPVASVAMLTRLKALGLGLSMDDFGTGYSSLTQLKRLPLDRLKIDRAFVREVLTDAADQAVVQAVIAMGHALRLRIIAEGVETTEQRSLLADYGCDEVQGYLCGRPMPPDRIDDEIKALRLPLPA